MLNAVKSVLADVSSVSPSSEQKCCQGKCQFHNEPYSVFLFQQILSDEKKRQQFDNYGNTGTNQGGPSRGQPFFDPHGGFSFFFNGMPYQNADHITARAYENSILPSSYDKPFLLEIIADWCFSCECGYCFYQQIFSFLIKYLCKDGSC